MYVPGNDIKQRGYLKKKQTGIFAVYKTMYHSLIKCQHSHAQELVIVYRKDEQPALKYFDEIKINVEQVKTYRYLVVCCFFRNIVNKSWEL